MTTGTHTPPALSAADGRFLSELARQLRVDSIRCSTAAGSGHPTSAMSAADLMAVLLARHPRYDWDNPGEPGNDHLIFSKGHASPLLYAMFKAAGAVTDEELVTGFRRFGSRLQGHPTPVLPWVDVATGSLGQGLPCGVGIALTSARYAERPVVVLARTVKGKGFAEVEDKNGWHGRPLPADMAERAVAALGGHRNLRVTTARPGHHDAPRHQAAAVTLPRYEISSKVATRKAYGDALVALGVRPGVVALDGEVGNSTYAGEFAAACPDRFFEMFIAEQQLIAAAVGLAVRGYVPFASTFAAFFSRGCTRSSPSTRLPWRTLPRRPAGGWSSPRTTTPRAAWAQPRSRRWPVPGCRCGSGSAR